MTSPLQSLPDLPSEKSGPKWLVWAKAHQEIIAVIGILIILMCVGIPYYLHSVEQSEKDATQALNLGQYYLHSAVDPKNGPFKTNQEKDQQALQAFQRITTDYSGTRAAKIARFYVAKCQFFLGQFNLAYASFDFAVQELKDTPLGEESYLGKVLCLESQSQWTQAITLLETRLKLKPDSYLVPEMLLRLANCYLKTQNKLKAMEVLGKTAETYKNSDWGKEAARRLEALKS